MGGGRATGFTDTDTEPRQEQLRKILRRPAYGGHYAPDGDGDGDDIATITDIGPASDGDTQSGINAGEG